MAAPEVTAWAGGSVWSSTLGAGGGCRSHQHPSYLSMLGWGLSQLSTLGLGVPTMVIDASGGSSTVGAVQIKKENSPDGPEDWRSSSPS